MASYSGHSSDLDRALDGLGFSYLDGVPFRIDPRIEALSNYDYSRTNELLSRPLPPNGLSEMCSNLLDRIGSLEKQVLEQVEALDKEKEARSLKAQQDEDELTRKREAAKMAEEEAAKAKEENEEVDQDDLEENVENGNADMSPGDTETEPSTASISDVLPQPAKILSSSNQESTPAISEGTGTKPININFSEFEAESDPFEKAELQTLNDLQELAAVLQTTANSAFPVSTSASVYSTSPMINAASGISTTSGPMRYPYYTSMQQHPNPYYYQQSHHRAPVPPFFPPYHGMPQQPVPQPMIQQPPPPPPEMKGSKSVGDIMAEIKKEAEALEKMKIRGHQRKNSQTPPPRVSPNPPRTSEPTNKNVLDDWVPWPDIGQTSSSSRLSENQRIMSDLSPSSQDICKQISEMGFSLARVAQGCKSLGSDKQKIINFCLLVDKFVNSSAKFSAGEVEYVIPMYNLDEESSRKHLKAFYRLEELGFDRIAIHNALISSQLDHDKALEKLLK